MFNDDIQSLVARRYTLGTSTILGITAIAGQNSVLLRQISGGTLEIGGASLFYGQGYLLDSSKEYSWPSIGTFYLCSSGATSIVSVLHGRSSAPI